MLANILLGMGSPCGFAGAFPGSEVGIQVLASLAIEAGQKNSAKCYLPNSFQWKNALNYF